MSEDNVFAAGLAIFFFIALWYIINKEYKDRSETDLRHIIDVLCYVESDNGANLDHAGDELGILGIRPIMVDEVNRVGKESFTYNDRKSEIMSRRMCGIFLTHQVMWYIGKYNRIPTEYMIVSSWHTGSIVSPVDTKYIKRYIECKKRLI